MIINLGVYYLKYLKIIFKHHLSGIDIFFIAYLPQDLLFSSWGMCAKSPHQLPSASFLWLAFLSKSLIGINTDKYNTSLWISLGIPPRKQLFLYIEKESRALDWSVSIKLKSLYFFLFFVIKKLFPLQGVAIIYTLILALHIIESNYIF